MTYLDLPALFELRFRKEAYAKVKGKFTRDEDRDSKLPDTPPQMSPFRGTYAQVAKEAIRLNEIQFRSGFQHYLFFPEPVPMEKAA